MIVGRLAPSPTGAQHLGNARTYLAAYWSALKQRAHLMLRIEDIDSPRVKPWAMQQAVDDLTWLGIEWHEGPDKPADHSPYIQSERSADYAEAIDRLVKADRVYPCTCTRNDIANAASAPHDGDGVVVYPGTCAGWSDGDPVPESGTYCWRFRVGDDPVRFLDAFAGPQSVVPSTHLGDFPISRKSGDAAYQLAVVVDDAAMGVSEVVRGDDLIDSTFWQLELYDALGHQSPRFVHLPLVVGEDGRRLAKRHGDTRLSHLRDAGIRPDEIVSWAASSFGMNVPSDPTDAQADLPSLHAHYATQLDWADLNRERVVPPEQWLRV